MLGTKNRFAALKIDDDEDEGAAKKSAASNQNQSNAAAKKKNKKKTKEDAEALRNMAFGTGRVGTKQQKHSGSGGQQQSQSGKPVSTEDWEEWQRRDNQSTDEMYREDIEKALLLSRLEEEQRKETQKQAAKEGKTLVLTGEGAAGGKKKKKKDKPQAMSLDQFNQLAPETLPASDDEVEEPAPPPVHTRVPITCQDTQYFESVATDADRLLQKERIQEQYQKAYAHESAMQSKYQEENERKQKRIEELESVVVERDNELKVVKARSVRLCKILAEGEMKEKTNILMQVEELTTDKELLTEQLASLTAELEKERSKNHALKLENDKLKGKHGK